MRKILIVIRGGNIQTIATNDKDLRIVIVDHDNNIDDQNGFVREEDMPIIIDDLTNFFDDDEITNKLKELNF
jgi:hypothetical protein